MKMVIKTEYYIIVVLCDGKSTRTDFTKVSWPKVSFTEYRKYLSFPPVRRPPFFVFS